MCVMLCVLVSYCLCAVVCVCHVVCRQCGVCACHVVCCACAVCRAKYSACDELLRAGAASIDRSRAALRSPVWALISVL